MSDDEYLRDSGFLITDRPNDADPTWKHCTGRVMTQAAAIALLATDSQEARRLRHLAIKRKGC